MMYADNKPRKTGRCLGGCTGLRGTIQDETSKGGLTKLSAMIDYQKPWKVHFVEDISSRHSVDVTPSRHPVEDIPSKTFRQGIPSKILPRGIPLSSLRHVQGKFQTSLLDREDRLEVE